MFLAIYSTLFVGKPLANQLRSQDVQVVFFVLGMLLIASAVLVHGLNTQISHVELSILLGIIAVYVMFIFRLGAPERSHLIDYSVLAIFIHKVFVERARHKNMMLKPPLLALVFSFSIGVLDEFIQLFLPNRVFDPEDILFNGIAVTMVIASTSLLMWVRMRVDTSRNPIEK